MAVDKTIKINVDAKDGIKQVDQLKKGVKDTSTAAAGTKGAFSKMTTGVKGLGVAFKALGIGLIVAAFVKLKDIFSGNIETARRFERIAAQVSAAFDVLRDRTENFIKALIDLKNPFKAFKDSFTGTRKEIQEETKAIDELTIALQKVRDEEREMTVERAKANKIIAQSRLLAEDETKTMQERLVALKAAIAEEKRVADLELQTQAKRVKALQEIIDLGKSSEEDLIELENERAKLIDLQTASILKQKRVVTEINTFEKQIVTEEKNREKAKLKIEQDRIKAKEKELALEKKAADDLLKLKEKEARELKAIEDKKAADELLIREQRIATVKAMEIQAAQSILGSLGQLAGEGTKIAKTTAIAQILINSAQGVSAAIKAGAGLTFPANLGAIASGVASVLSGIASAKGILSQVSGGNNAPDTNVDISSNPAVVGDMLPNMEAIAPPTLGGQTPVQAYVVENDISNAQALQEELNIQATL